MQISHFPMRGCLKTLHIMCMIVNNIELKVFVLICILILEMAQQSLNKSQYVTYADFETIGN